MTRQPLPWWLAVVPLLTWSVAPADDAGEARFDDRAVVEVVERAIAARAFPGVALACGTAEGLVWSAGFGHLDYDGGREVRPDTIYDLASLTKVVGTTCVLMRLAAAGQFDPARPAAEALPLLPADFNGSGEQRRWREALTLEQLLRHRGGLPSWRAFHRDPGIDGYEPLLAAVIGEPLEASPGSRYRYSDLGFVLLGEAAGRLAGRPLAQLERELVFEPLGMRRTTREVPRSWRRHTAPTERWPEGLGRGHVHAVVHDENARAGEGLTGHAGLFSTAPDLALLAAELLRGAQGRSGMFPREVVERFTGGDGADGGRHALGWQRYRGRAGDFEGGKLSAGSFGHQGFTGTSIWIDPRRGVFVIALTNRVHPHRGGDGWLRARGPMVDAVLEGMGF